MVDEVFGTAEVDEGTVNPTHLNLANRTRWLCEQTMRSNKRINEIVEQQKEMKAEIQANQAVDRGHKALCPPSQSSWSSCTAWQ